MSVKLEDDKLIIEDFETSESEIVSYFSEVEPTKLEERLGLALKIGSIALRTIGTTERVDYIQKEFNRLENKYNKALTQTFADIDTKINAVFGEDGKLTKSLIEYFGDEGAVSKVMAEHFGEKGTFSTIVEKQFGEDGVLAKDVFSPTKPGTPLFQLRSLLVDEITKLGKELGISEAVQEVIEETPKKGAEFEDDCEVWLEEIASKYTGYKVKKTGKETGAVKGSFKGDFVVDISELPDTRIVLETKDLRNKISQPEISLELEGAIKNRDASYGIFVSKWKEALPVSVGIFNEYDGKYLICALTSKDHEGYPHPEILHMAIGWARNRLLMKSVIIEDLDFDLLHSKMEEIRKKINRFSLLETECTNAETAVARIRGYSDEIKIGIEKQLEEMNKELARTSVSKTLTS